MTKIIPKVGQVWRANNKNAKGCGSLVITYIVKHDPTDETCWDISYILFNGETVPLDSMYHIKKSMELVAEYPTWQEAVNSKEFKA